MGEVCLVEARLLVEAHSLCLSIEKSQYYFGWLYRRLWMVLATVAAAMRVLVEMMAVVEKTKTGKEKALGWGNHYVQSNIISLSGYEYSERYIPSPT